MSGLRIRDIMHSISKEPILENATTNKLPAIKRYSNFFVGNDKFGAFVQYEIITTLFGSLSGGLGLILRKWTFKYLFKKMGYGVLIGKNCSFRHPKSIEFGERVAVDDYCLFDGRGGSKSDGIKIGSDVLIARNCVINAKTAWIEIGDKCVIGNNTSFWSGGGIILGKSVGIAGHCYIGGGRSRYDLRNVPILEQESYSKGPVVIEDDVWIGAGVTILDGVHIGKGSIIGAGATIMSDVKEYSILIPQQKYYIIPRG